MVVNGYFGGLMCVLFVTSHLSTAAPNQAKPAFMAEYPGCPMYQVGQKFPMHQVTMEDKLTLMVKPNYPTLIMDIAALDQQIYQVTVDGSMIELYKCDMEHDKCEEVNSGASKSSNLLNADEWNYVNVSLVDSQITISVGMNQNVMGKAILMESDGQQQPSLKLSIVGPNDQQQMISLPDDYSVDVNLFCNSTYAPIVEEMPAVTTEEIDVSPAPYPDCELYEVAPNKPVQIVKLEGSLTMAVFPSEPAVCMHIMLNEELYKATIDGTMTQLAKCNKDAKECKEIVGEGGNKGSDMFEANKWNYITISLDDGMINLSVNTRSNVTGDDMSIDSDTEVAEVSIVPVKRTASQSGNTDYTVSVNIFCNETMPTPVIRSETTTINSLNTPEAVVEEGETPTTGEEGSGSRNIIIVVVVLGVILCIIVIALVVTSIKKRRTATINQHTPLAEQQQH